MKERTYMHDHDSDDRQGQQSRKGEHRKGGLDKLSGAVMLFEFQGVGNEASDGSLQTEVEERHIAGDLQHEGPSAETVGIKAMDEKMWKGQSNRGSRAAAHYIG